ncbi:FHA domain-containing protein [Nonomuraea sp. NPDC050540]|uniref:FHA domain-containing protein n=1 Tax=Nonomuraea sp. NPDC050540 TaxID=3364367 RepID=UPI00378A72D9
MATCPSGHPSGADDYCDVCGTQMPGGSGAASPAVQSPTRVAAAPAGGEPCPVCQAPRAGQFCEVCGHDFNAPADAQDHRGPGPGPGPGPLPRPPTPTRWEAIAGADRAYFNEIIAEGGPDAAAMAFPPYCPERSFAMAGRHVRIGRHRSSGGNDPEIDLSGPPQDPGVSHLHAVLLLRDDGGWDLVDPGSANGTRVNGKALKVNVPVPVKPGDRIHVGAWTVITIRENMP